MQYRLRVMEPSGTLATWAVDAQDEADARAQAHGKNLKVLTVQGVNATARMPFSAGRFSVSLFCEELLSMLGAGLSVVECIEGLASKEASADGAAMFARMLRQLREGQRFSDALGSETQLFPPLLVAIVRSSEMTSSLPESLERYLRYQAQVEGITRKLVSASIYPLVLLVVGGLVTVFLLGYVVPKFSAVYRNTGRDLPALSQMMMVWGAFAGRYAEWLMAGFIAFVAAGIYGLRALLASQGIAGLMAKLPGLRGRARLLELSRLYMTQGMLMAGGIPAPEALRMAGDVLSPARRAQCAVALEQIRAGLALSDAFESAGLATPIALKYFRAGERSGNLADMMTRAARFYDDEMARFVERFSKAFEPVLMALIGVVVGTIVVLLYLPIFDLAGSLQ